MLTAGDYKDRRIAPGRRRQGRRHRGARDRELARIGLFDPGELFAEDGSLLPIKNMPPEVRAAIASIEVEEIDADGKVIGRVKKVKLWDKNSAATSCSGISAPTRGTTGSAWGVVGSAARGFAGDR
ncbi:MAG: hypothetical protein IPH39_18880 [Sulfuritalea sp.]|nr:hypothetical protein [Sulfuritalea sp.]